MILEWNILHRVDSLVCTPKKQQSSSITFKSCNQMALDRSRLGLENKSGRIFCVRQVYVTKSCQQIWGCVNQPLILLIHHIWVETVLFIIQTSDRMHYFTIFQDKLHSVNSQDDQSWALSETVQNISKNHLHGQPVLTFDKPQICSASFCTVFEWILVELRFNIIKNLLCLFFYLMVL